MTDAELVQHPIYGPLVRWLAHLASLRLPEEIAVTLSCNEGRVADVTPHYRRPVTDPREVRLPWVQTLAADQRAVVETLIPLVEAVEAAGLSGQFILTVTAGRVQPIPEWKPGKTLIRAGKGR